MPKSLDGLKILVVEDELLTAMTLRGLIQDLGGAVVGPVGRLAQAEDLARQEAFDGAILDVRLSDETTLGLAEALIGRGIPVVLSTGYERDMLPKRFADVPRLPKPYDNATFRAVAERHFRRR